ncbi:D-alanyl-lipoteichoic acid biosynthesis protein DltD, partial [Bacillus cereus]
DKYFLKDHMHLGWKGWVYIDEAIQQFYKVIK